MSGQCITKIPHDCGTSDGLQVFDRDDGTVDGFCFPCGKYVRHPYGNEKSTKDLPKPIIKTSEEVLRELEEITSYPVVDIRQKKLRKETLDFFGIKVAVSEADGETPTALYYPYHIGGQLTGYKVKILETKRMWAIGSTRDVDFFGWQQALKQGARKIVITEGEDDAVALKRVIQRHSKSGYADYYAVVSLPSGAGSAKDMVYKNKDLLFKTFEEVILCFDQDKVGLEAVEDVVKLVPECTVMTCPDKDANDAVINGKSKALFNALWKAEAPKNTRLVFADDIFDDSNKPTEMGQLTYPWPHINKPLRNIRYGTTTYIGAGTKMGKSEVVDSMAVHFVTHDGVKVFLAKPEQTNGETMKKLAGKVAGIPFHDPEVPWDQEAYDKAGDAFRKEVALVNLYQHVGWESLQKDIIAAVNWGAKAVMIDPITNLTAGVPPGEANTLLQTITSDLSVMALDMNFAAFIFCHLKAHEGDIPLEKRKGYYAKDKYIGLGACPHEKGGTVLSSQFAGSRSMQQKCHTMLALEGNRDEALDENIRNMRSLKILEEREFGATGAFPLFWNKNTTLFKEI